MIDNQIRGGYGFYTMQEGYIYVIYHSLGFKRVQVGDFKFISNDNKVTQREACNFTQVKTCIVLVYTNKNSVIKRYSEKFSLTLNISLFNINNI